MGRSEGGCGKQSGLAGRFSFRTRKRSMDEIPQAKSYPAAKRRSAKSDNAVLKRLVQLYPEVQLATLVDQPPQGPQWLHEIKFDGYRLLGFCKGSQCLRTRNGKDWTTKFP